MTFWQFLFIFFIVLPILYIVITFILTLIGFNNRMTALIGLKPLTFFEGVCCLVVYIAFYHNFEYFKALNMIYKIGLIVIVVFLTPIIIKLIFALIGIILELIGRFIQWALNGVE